MRHSLSVNASVLLLGGLLLAPLCRSQSAIPGTDPFTGAASIPAGADTRSIRFESLKQVRFPGRLRPKSPLPVVEVTYSYYGVPLVSDEHGGRLFTFQVYFHPSDLPPGLLEALSGGRKPGRATTSRYFEVATYREPAPRYVLDPRRSLLCEGTYLDGSWQPDDPDCDYIIRTNVVRGLSDFITVSVTPVASPPSR
jgi:hypothetical protein